MKPVTDMTPDELARALRQIEVIKIWIKAVEEHAAKRIQQEPIPGFKLVATPARRHWTDEAEARKALVDKGLTEDDAAPRKTISPAQAEKLLGKASVRDLRDLIGSGGKGTTLAPEEDPRDAVPSKAEDARRAFSLPQQ